MDFSNHWQDICHAIQEGVFLVDPTGRIVMVNDAMVRLTGFPREELLGKSCRIFECDACELSRRQGKGSWCGLFAGGKPRPKRCVIARKDGLRIPVFKNQSLIRDGEGRLIGAVESVMDLTELDRLDRKVEALSRILDEPAVHHGMVGRSPAMRRLFEIIEKAARTGAPVLLLGESGTGKELAARAVHELGPRKDGPFVELNCAALNESLLESELFGHAKGAFTGAHRSRRGRFEEAHGGDIFLDEIGDAPLSIQTKLLRVLETKTVERVGENRPVQADARLIAATRQDLRALIAQGRFREDFYFRINVIPIVLPPLRERMEDLPLLADHFLHLAASRAGGTAPHLTPEAMRVLMAHAWPGNVRELRSAMEYAMMLQDEGRIGPEHLPAGLGLAAPEASWRQAACAAPVQEISQGLPVGFPPGPATEREALVQALRRSGGNKSQAARLLGVTRLTVQNRMRKYGVSCEKTVTV